MKSTLMAFTALAVAPLMAHHGDAGRYRDEVSTVTGTVVALQLVNPHSTIVFDVEDDEGNVVRWQAEVSSPRQLAANFGWDRNTVVPGIELQFTGRVVKSGAPYINLNERARIVLVDTCEEIYHSRSLPENPLNC
jgi:hypothetical protein